MKKSYSFKYFLSYNRRSEKFHLKTRYCFDDEMTKNAGLFSGGGVFIAISWEVSGADSEKKNPRRIIFFLALLTQRFNNMFL